MVGSWYNAHLHHFRIVGGPFSDNAGRRFHPSLSARFNTVQYSTVVECYDFFRMMRLKYPTMLLLDACIWESNQHKMGSISAVASVCLQLSGYSQ